LVSDKAGSSEIIVNGRNGFVIQAPYAQNMALHIEQLIIYPELREIVGKGAYEFVKENLSWGTYAKKMAAVFEKAVLGYKN